MYYNYCTDFSSKNELELDNLRVKQNREEFITTILSSKELLYAFALGNAFVILFGAIPVWADDLKPAKQAKKQLAKRVSNAIGCSAITLVCSKAAKSPDVVKVAATEVSKSGNPQVIAAFACGAAVAWCAKYAIFDK